MFTAYFQEDFRIKWWNLLRVHVLFLLQINFNARYVRKKSFSKCSFMSIFNVNRFQSKHKENNSFYVLLSLFHNTFILIIKHQNNPSLYFLHE